MSLTFTAYKVYVRNEIVAYDIMSENVLKIYSFVGNTLNDLVEYVMQNVRNGLMIHLTKSLKSNIC